MSTDGRAFELLRQANPVPVADLEPLAARAEALRPLVSEPALPRRRRVPRLRVAVSLLAIAVGFVLVAPALGLHVPVLDFWQAEKAPPRVVQDFDSLSVGAPAGMDPGAVPGEAGKVTTIMLADGPHTLWVAPTRAGGFCLTWTNASGGCDKLGTVPLSVSWSSAGPLTWPKGGSPELTPASFTRLSGHVNADDAEAVEIRFADGDVVRPDVTWVSDPIRRGVLHLRRLLVGALDERVASVELRFADGDRVVVHPRSGFVLYELPAEHLVRGREASEIASLDLLGKPLHPRFKVTDLGGTRFPCLAPLPLGGKRSGPFCP